MLAKMPPQVYLSPRMDNHHTIHLPRDHAVFKGSKPGDHVHMHVHAQLPVKPDEPLTVHSASKSIPIGRGKSAGDPIKRIKQNRSMPAPVKPNHSPKGVD